MSNIYPIKLYSPKTKNTVQVLAYICDRCNYDCWYCYNKKPRSNKLLDLNKLNNFINSLQNQTKKEIKLELIGGEPTLHPNLYDFCKKTINDKISINIYTNFSQTLFFYQKLLDLNCLLSITYHNQDRNLFLSKLFNLGTNQQKNLFDLAIMYESGFTENSIYIYNQFLSNTLYKKNILLSLVLSDTTNKILSKYTKAELEQYKFYTQNTIAESDDFYVLYNDKSIKKLSYNDLQLDYEYSCKNWKCYAGVEYLDVDVNGDVYSCISCNRKIFNIYNKTNLFRLPTKPMICSSKYCQCRWDITKERVFKLK